jgi:hypothetical protein
VQREHGASSGRARNPAADLLGLRTGEQDPALPPLDRLKFSSKAEAALA